MSLPFGLAHAGGGERDDDGVSLQEVVNGDSAELHVVALLFLGVDVAVGLVDLEEVLDD